MSLQNPTEDEYAISFSDFKAILKKNLSKIILCTVGMALFASFWTLTKEPKYILESSFKEKGKTQVGLSKSLAEALFSGSGGATESEAASLMKSRKLTEQLVRNLDLQGKVFYFEKNHEYLAAIRDNLIVDLAHFNNARHPVLPDPQPPLLIQNITYKEETPLNLDIKFSDEDNYTVFNGNEEIGKGELGELFEFPRASFTLHRNTSRALTDEKLGIELQPLFFVAENISRNLMIMPDKNDKNLLVLRLPYRDRYQGSKILNELMNIYLSYLHDEHMRISDEQLNYLQDRRLMMGAELKKMMDDHAVSLSSDLSTTGFANSTKAMEFMAAAQNDYRQKLLSIDMETKRLQTAQEEDFIYYDRYTSHGDPAVINEVLAEIRGLKQQADSLDIALRETQRPDIKIMSEQMEDLQTIQDYTKDTQLLIASLEKKELPKNPLKISGDSKYMVQTWVDKLAEAHKEMKAATPKTYTAKKQQLDTWVNNFDAYLNNLLHLLQVHERTLEEQLAHQQKNQSEFKGIDLATARELYMNYTRQLNEVQAQLLQTQFIIEQMKDPTFEMSSLSSILNDSVSRELITKASTIALSLRDQNNRSVKEQERLKEELDLEKGFVEMHLKQTQQLYVLREKLLKDKINDLQNVTLGLVHQRISILEKHLDEYITTRLSNLKQERSLIHDNQLQLQKEMAKLPNKWVAEKLIDQQMNMNQMMVEELSKMVESKNISTNLEMVLSGPIDQAQPPILPKSPRLLLYVILGTLVGSFLSVTYFVVRAVIDGIQASPQNLELMNQHVSGCISNQAIAGPTHLYPDNDLETLRKIISYLAPGEGSHEIRAIRPQSLIVIQGEGPDYSLNLAELMTKKGFKVALLPLRFDQASKPEELPGLLQYIEGEAPGPKINRHYGVDVIAPGGITRFDNEMICSPAFTDLITTLQEKYDWIIAVSPVKPTSAQAESLVKYFDHSVVNIFVEKLPELQSLFALIKSGKPRKKATFIFYKT